jgi:hypothetical protein
MDFKQTEHLWLDASLKIEGQWWPSFAETEKEKESLSRHGILSYSPSAGAFLTLHHGKIGLGWGSNIILGGSEESLLSPRVTCHGIHAKDWKHGCTTFRVDYVFQGFHLADFSKSKFIELALGIKNLNQWVRTSGFNFKRSKGNRGFRVSYTEQKGKAIRLDKAVSIKISKWAPMPNETFGFGRIETNERISFHVKTRKRAGLEFSRILDYLPKITDFFTLASMSLSNPHDIYIVGDFGYTKGFRGKLLPSGARLYLSGIHHDDQWFETQKFDFLFCEEDLELPMKDHLSLWLSKYHLIRVPFSLYQSAAFRDDTTENKFLLLCQAIETFHRNLRGGNYLAEKEYLTDVLEPMVTAIPSTLPKDLRMALRNRLMHGNEFALRKRLAELIDLHSAILSEHMTIPKTLAGDIANARNYLTHRPNAEPPKNFGLLGFYSTVLRSLFVLSVLTEIGFTSGKIALLAKKCEWFRSLQYNAPRSFKKG